MTTTPDARTVALIVGSVSQPSLNRRLADALAVLAPDAGLELRDVPIGDLPFFGAHMQSAQDYPEEGRALKRTVDGADGLLIVTPEYNRSIPGVLKNAIDWASRPEGESSFPGRPVAVIGTSEGDISTAVAQNHLKAILTSQGAQVLGEPEAYVKYEEGLIGDDGLVTDTATREFLAEFLGAFRDLIDRFA
ncbi:UNVERIFIED_CONTAM: NAD(P)H-dependent oxidoreductase [Microbacterium sp. SLM126]